MVSERKHGESDVAFNIALSRELRRAVAHGEEYHSIHEAYAVLLEEVDEFWEHVRCKRVNRRPEEIFAELVQIATVAQKAARSFYVPEGNT